MLRTMKVALTARSADSERPKRGLRAGAILVLVCAFVARFDYSPFAPGHAHADPFHLHIVIGGSPQARKQALAHHQHGDPGTTRHENGVVILLIRKPADGAVLSFAHMPGAAPDARHAETSPWPALGWLRPTTSSFTPAVPAVPDPPPRT
jgi:hypothetical protein